MSDTGLKEDEGQWRGGLHTGQAALAGSADSLEFVLISYFYVLLDDWGHYGATLQESRAGKERKGTVLTKSTHKSGSRETVNQRCEFSVFAHICTGSSPSAISQGHAGNVCQREWRGETGDQQRTSELCCISGSRRSC